MWRENLKVFYQKVHNIMRLDMAIFALIFSTLTVIYFFYKNPYFLNGSISEAITKYKKILVEIVKG